jgi:hypothetical protein
MGTAGAAAAGTAEPVSPEEYEKSLSRLLQKVAAVSGEHGVKAMLVFTPAVRPDAEGGVFVDVRPEEKECFERLCAENGIIFLDLSEKNAAAVTEDRRLPFGFVNTAPGEGHINSLGLELFADAVYERIREGEGTA